MENLTGAGRAAAQATMLAGITAWSLKHRDELGLRRRQLPRHIADLLTIAAGPSEVKYVHFGRRIFVDGWIAPWPSLGFHRSLSMVPRFANDPDPARIRSCVYAAVSMTRRCMYRCEHCYTAHTLARRDAVPRDVLLRTVDRMMELGVGILSLEGGEPLLRYDDLLAVLDLVRGRACPYIATTGWSLTPERARELAAHGLVAAQVSLDSDDPDVHNSLRRSPKAFDVAVEAIGNLRAAGVFPMISMLATSELIADGGFYRFLELARKVGAGMIQVLDPMPAGANLEGDVATRRLGRAERQAVADFQAEANTHPRWKDHPAISARLYSESEDVAGCSWGGLGTYYIDGLGNVEPCVYANMSVGNILEEDFDVIHQRMRRLFPRPVGGLCPAYSPGKEEARALAEGRPVPLSPDETARLAERFARRPLPKMLQKLVR